MPDPTRLQMALAALLSLDTLKLIKMMSPSTFKTVKLNTFAIASKICNVCVTIGPPHDGVELRLG